MTVYVDDMYKSPMGRFGRMKMSHMMASGGEEELLEFVDKIGLDRKWIQYPGRGRHRVHFDVSMSMRKKAIENGAVPVSMMQLARLWSKWQSEDRNE